MEVGDKSCRIQINPSDYLDLASGTQRESSLEPTQICKAKSWSLEHREVGIGGQPSHLVMDFTEITYDQVCEMPSRIRIFDNPLVSLDTARMVENRQDVSRSVSLITNPAARSLASESTDTFTSISTCIEKTSSEFTKLPFKKLSPKFKKYNKKEVLEITELSTMSPVEKRKISKASEFQKISEQDCPKSSKISVGQGKRPSVVFNLMGEGKGEVYGKEDDDFPPRPSYHVTRRISEFGARGPRPSIFSVFSQVASRSHRPSIFSRLSDFSIGSFTSNYSWNYRKVFGLVFASFSFFIIVTLLLVFIWPKLEYHEEERLFHNYLFR